MIEKIISGGQTGADQAALDTAIKWNIPHGGWIPKGRLTEAGRLPDRYKMQEMPTDSYAARTEKNVLDSDGTLIISHGPLAYGAKFTKEMSFKHNKPFLHIDLNELDVPSAARRVYEWISEIKIKTINVAGSRASIDPSIYQAVMHLLTNVLIMDLIEVKMSEPLEPLLSKHGTIDHAVNSLISKMSLRERCYIGNMAESELFYLDITLGAYIRRTFGIKSENKKLINTCKELLGKNEINDDEITKVLLKALWKKLNETHVLKIIKK